MAQNVLQRAHSYTLIRPGSSQKIVVRRGQSIDHLDDADQRYLASKSITPPMVDDSHAPVGRVPLFGPIVDEDVKGEATVEDVAPVQEVTAGGAAQSEPVKVSIEVSAAAGLEAALATEDGAAAGGADDAGGDDTASAEGAAPAVAKRRAPNKRKPASKKS